MCEYCDDRGHWHTNDKVILARTRVLISSGKKSLFVIRQAGVECYTRINYCPMCGRKL